MGALAVVLAAALSGTSRSQQATDVADTGGGKSGGTIATAFVSVDSRSSACTTKIKATTAAPTTAPIIPRLYMAQGYGRSFDRRAGPDRAVVHLR